MYKIRGKIESMYGGQDLEKNSRKFNSYNGPEDEESYDRLPPEKKRRSQCPARVGKN